MRVAIFSDIHGNLVALEDVLADIAQEQVDQVVCLGDVAATGPQPVDTINRLKVLNCPMVMGNTDTLLLNPQAYTSRKKFLWSEEDSRRIVEIDQWCARQLSPADLDYLRTFKPTVQIPLGSEAKLLCFHGSAHSNTDVIISTTSDEDLERMLSGFHATVMAGGHTHTQMVRRYKDSILINPGSVGLPFELNPDTGQVYNPSWAEYALVGSDKDKLGVELRRVPIDIDGVVRAALNSGMPHAGWWAGDWRQD